MESLCEEPAAPPKSLTSFLKALPSSSRAREMRATLDTFEREWPGLRFEDRERLAYLRAERLKREREASPLRLDASHRSTSPSLRLVEATHRSLASTTPQEWGRWIARACAQDGATVLFQA